MKAFATLLLVLCCMSFREAAARQKTCLTSCGALVQANWRGWVDSCSKYRCKPNGELKLIRTKRNCTPRCNTCETTCGRVVPHGWDANDDGDNFCNGCTCKKGRKTCTEIGCGEGEPCPAAASCRTRCGREVPHGWYNNNDGDDFCNTCECDNGSLVCTEKGCSGGSC